MVSLLTRGLHQHARLLGILSAGLFLFEWALVWVATRIDMGPGFRQILGSLLPPDVVEIIFGQFGFASFEGAVSFGYQHPMALTGAMAMVVVMATLPALERETGFLDLVLSRPLTRIRYLTAAVLLMGVTAVLPPLALLSGGAVGLYVVDAPAGVTWSRYLPAGVMLGLLLLAVGSYTLLFATEARRRGTAVAQTVGVTLLFYWLDFMGDYWDLLETARALSPFHYFDPASVSSQGISLGDAAVLGMVGVACCTGAFFNFRRQNL